MPTATLWLNQLQECGYRITRPLQAIVEILLRSERALTPTELYDLGRKEYPQLGLVTVYRTLEKLEQQGLVQRIHTAQGCHLYLRNVQGHQHVLLCTGCGQAVYFEGDDLSNLINNVSARTGFEVREHWLQLMGICPNCRA